MIKRRNLADYTGRLNHIYQAVSLWKNWGTHSLAIKSLKVRKNNFDDDKDNAVIATWNFRFWKLLCDKRLDKEFLDFKG